MDHGNLLAEAVNTQGTDCTDLVVRFSVRSVRVRTQTRESGYIGRSGISENPLAVWGFSLIADGGRDRD